METSEVGDQANIPKTGRSISCEVRELEAAPVETTLECAKLDLAPTHGVLGMSITDRLSLNNTIRSRALELNVSKNNTSGVWWVE